jgi:nicotinamide riboside transporter PnuC
MGEQEENRESPVERVSDRGGTLAWIMVVGIALLFALWGLLIFTAVGDKGPPTWDFGAVQDVPGESPYSTDRP